jgi:multidrug efflux pump subunit AcrA (membrane-fusion protein)
VFKKILLLVVLAAFAAVATEALSQNQASPSAPATSKTPPAPEKSLPPNTASPFKAGDTPAAVKAQPAAFPVPSTRSEAKTPEAPAPASKDASTSKTFPTTSAYVTSSPGALSGRKELVVERALVTLIHDNKVPASEAGMLTEVPVEEGHSVEEGALVAQIDIRSTVARQRIAEQEHYAALAQAENDAEIEVAEKAIEVSKADLDANEEIRRVNKNAVSASEHRKYIFQYEKSLAQKKQAINEKKIAGMTAQAKKAQYDAASIELDLRQARAPFKGQVVEVMKKPGDWVTAGEPIMHIVGLDRVKVKGFVLVSGPNGASHDEVIGKPVTITVHSAGDKKHTVKGIIGFASPVIEGVGTSRQFRIWAEVDNEKAIDPVTKVETWKIQPGSMASMTIDLTAPKPAALAPAKGKGQVNAYKPVTGEGNSDTKKAPRVR